MKTVSALVWYLFWLFISLAALILVLRFLKRAGSGNIVGRVASTAEHAIDPTV